MNRRIRRKHAKRDAARYLRAAAQWGMAYATIKDLTGVNHFLSNSYVESLLRDYQTRATEAIGRYLLAMAVWRGR